MPWDIRPNEDGTVRVVNKETGKVHAKRTTPEKAAAQIRVMSEAEGLDWETPKHKADKILKRRGYK